MHGQVSGDGSGLFVWDTYLYDFDIQQMRCFITIEKSGEHGRVSERTHCPLSFSWVLPDQIRMLASAVGFVVEAVYGDFSNGGFNSDSLNQVWYLRKPS
jgi:hypothetical protein